MSGRQEGKSRATAWALSILAVPVLYVLSAPPLFAFCLQSPVLHVTSRLIPQLRVYAGPYFWLANHTPLAAPLRAYTHYWLDPVLTL